MGKMWYIQENEGDTRYASGKRKRDSMKLDLPKLRNAPNNFPSPNFAPFTVIIVGYPMVP